jgi:hypothetical protein
MINPFWKFDKLVALTLNLRDLVESSQNVARCWIFQEFAVTP